MTEVTTVGLCNGVRCTGRELVGMVCHGNDEHNVGLSMSEVKSQGRSQILFIPYLGEEFKGIAELGVREESFA